MIDTEKLKEKIANVESQRNCSLDLESTKKLIIKVQREYESGVQKKLGFKNLVEKCAEAFELNYNYCRVAFSYLSSRNKKENVQKNKSTEHLQYHLAFK
ncbi:MAG: hypothetical protein QGG63_00105 [Candidatus Pacebacteria bacterium]|jgi:hypothetical protein|nr:hypothetical protein [Candidatus Paceibacterota bacterium]|tara:strand:- start:65759 stop:66055 length:297 start_codon:yes stop_codon:yes gene_type:complete